MGVVRSRDLFLIFEAPLLSLERLKLDISDLACGLIVMSASVSVMRYPSGVLFSGHCDLFKLWRMR